MVKSTTTEVGGVQPTAKRATGTKANRTAQLDRFDPPTSKEPRQTRDETHVAVSACDDVLDRCRRDLYLATFARRNVAARSRRRPTMRVILRFSSSLGFVAR